MSLNNQEFAEELEKLAEEKWEPFISYNPVGDILEVQVTPNHSYVEWQNNGISIIWGCDENMNKTDEIVGFKIWNAKKRRLLDVVLKDSNDMEEHK